MCAVVNKPLYKLFCKYIFYFIPFQQQSLKLIDNCTDGSAPSPVYRFSWLGQLSTRPVLQESSFKQTIS